MSSFKTRRKQSKYKQILKNEQNIALSEEPSRNLMVGNAGLVSGIQYEQMAKLFTYYGAVERVVMIPRKSYSFVVYTAVSDAEAAYQAVNGKVKLDGMDGPIYLVYTETVPSGCDASLQDSMPEGLTLLMDFVTCEEEESLLNCVQWDDSSHEAEKSLKHRRVKHYGYEFRYDINNVDKDSPLREGIPQECSFLASRLGELGYPLDWTPDQLTVNQYQRGQGIPSHIDTHSAFESPLLSLSLGSDVVMEFRRSTEHVSVLLPRRSLLIMDSQARYTWSHGITPRTMDVVSVAGGLSVQDRGCRTSFTFRRVRQGPCNCQYPDCCDSQQVPPSTTIPDHQASTLEELYVHQVYSKIANHFSETRTKIWPNVREFLHSFSPGSVIVDAGCGNGKYFGVNPHIFQVGFDRSSDLAEITQSRGHEVFVCDCLLLPLRDGVADGMISIAVLHHVATEVRRLQALREMSRVLAPGGRALVSVWAKDQTKKELTAYLKQDRKNRRRADDQREYVNVTKFDEVSVEERITHLTEPRYERGDKNDLDIQHPEFKLPVHTARTEFQHQDVFVPWKVKSKDKNESAVFLRYYHVFEESELLKLCSSLSDVNVLDTYYTEGNWCIIFEKNKPN